MAVTKIWDVKGWLGKVVIYGEVVSKEDFLSNKVLFYDREKEQLRIALPKMHDLQIGEKKEMER